MTANLKPLPSMDSKTHLWTDAEIIALREEKSRQGEAQVQQQTLQNAVDGLALSHPDESAKRLLTIAQIRILSALAVLIASSAALWPVAAFIALNVCTILYFISAIFFRVFLLALGWKDKIAENNTFTDDKNRLPIITLLLPLYKDAAALPMLASAIDELDYPACKMDVKFLFEASDPETIEEARRLRLGLKHQIVVIPDAPPRTKPKACNVGLQLAKGDLVVIYDAEDLPERDQLRKAAAAFEGGDDKLACVQARLNYYNRTDNWLTRMFTLEYSLWFDWLLPALQKMGAPIPLGGTSNFFRRETLVKVGGWDPYNVTEDADLGLRLSRLGYRVEVIASTTFEEANCDLNNWVRQRSRWLKGYLQTWLVHMRRPQRIIATTGWRGFLAVQLFVAGNIFSSLINPLMLLAFIAGAMWRPEVLIELFPKPLIYLNLFALVFGNLFFIAMMMMGPLKRGWGELSVFGLTAPVYWLLTSFAAYKALWQAVLRPHYWEKTDHVISAAARQKRNDALKTHFAEDSHPYQRRYANHDTINTRGPSLSENERTWQ